MYVPYFPLSFSPQPSRIQTGISLPLTSGGSVPKWTDSLRAALHFPWRSLIPFRSFQHAAFSREERLLDIAVKSLLNLVCRLRNSRSHSLLSLVWRLYSSSMPVPHNTGGICEPEAHCINNMAKEDNKTKNIKLLGTHKVTSQKVRVCLLWGSLLDARFRGHDGEFITFVIPAKTGIQVYYPKLLRRYLIKRYWSSPQQAARNALVFAVQKCTEGDIHPYIAQLSLLTHSPPAAILLRHRGKLHEVKLGFLRL